MASLEIESKVNFRGIGADVERNSYTFFQTNDLPELIPANGIMKMTRGV